MSDLLFYVIIFVAMATSLVGIHRLLTHKSLVEYQKATDLTFSSALVILTGALALTL